MNIITLVTGNPDKLAELQALLPPSLNIVTQDFNLQEIQLEDDPHGIVRHKLRAAYDIVQGPVIVDDVSAELEKLNGLPGPYIKLFQARLGKKEALYRLAGEGPVRIVCTMGFYDGSQEHIVDGIMHGRVVEPRDGEGFGFDFEVIPDGYDQTLSQLGPNIKNTISHRYLAASAMADFLRNY